MGDYLQELQDLRDLLRWLLRKEFLQELVALAELIDRSYVDSYCRISSNSSHGTNCGYAVKAKELFLKLQEKDISKKIEDIYHTFIEKK
ncbi:MAG: hypothetical protein DRN26_01080 [Thermoplasmata archaeon]|nr:MAG: hypothetical protein DRN26_01080 [Thermoplasmata archaeon]